MSTNTQNSQRRTIKIKDLAESVDQILVWLLPLGILAFLVLLLSELARTHSEVIILCMFILAVIFGTLQKRLIKTTKESYDLSLIPDQWDVTVDPYNRDEHEIQLVYYINCRSGLVPGSIVRVKQSRKGYTVEVQDLNADHQVMGKILPVAEQKVVDSFKEAQKLVLDMAEEYPMEETTTE